MFSETGPPLFGLLARGRDRGAKDGRLPAERRPVAFDSKFLAGAPVRPELVEADAPKAPSDTNRTAAAAAAAANLCTRCLPVTTYDGTGRRRRTGWVSSGP